MVDTLYKFVPVTPPGAIVDNAAFGTTVVDTLGFRYCVLAVHLGAVDIPLAALKVQESDAVSGGNLVAPADVPGTRVGTDKDMSGNPSALPTATDDNKFVLFEIDMRGRKRYLDLSLTGGDGTAGTYATAFALLLRPEVAPDRAADKGASLIMRVPGKD